MKYLILTGLTMVSCAGEQFKTDSKQIDSGILESDNPTGATRQDGSIFDIDPHTADNDGAPHLTDSSNIEILDGATDNSLSYDSSNTTTDSGNNCTTTFYTDIDNDGYGNPQSSTTACAVPPGHVTNDDDCYDGNPQVHPDQTGYFMGWLNGSVANFDYNCDGAIELKYSTYVIGTTENHCENVNCNSSVTDAQGWVNGSPNCGQSGSRVTCSWGLSGPTWGCFEVSIESQSQSCR